MRILLLINALIVVIAFAPVCRASDARFLDDRAAVARVFELLDERLGVMPDVAAYKWSRNAAIADPKREQVVIQNVVERAAPLGLEANGIRELFDLQIRLARDAQSELHDRWRHDRLPANQPVPGFEAADLDKTIRPKLDRITPELIAALYLAGAEWAREDFGSRYASLAAEKLSTPRWTDGARRETLSALSSIRLIAAPALDRIRAAGVIRIGTTGDYAPFTLLSGESLAGSDIELAESLAEKLGARPVFVRTTWASLMSDLAAYKFDIALGGVSITPARQAAAAFSIPYTTGGKTILSRCRDARRYATLAAVDRRGVRVIVNPGGTNEQFARDNIHHANVRVFPDNRAIFDEIRNGRADVMITDDVEVELQTYRHKELCRPFRGTFTQSDKAILVSRDASGVAPLLAAVNDWLAPEVEAGRPARLIEQFLHAPP